MAINQSLLAELQQEAPTTRRLLERVPEIALAWKPHEKSMTLGRLASHVAELTGWISVTIDTRELDLEPIKTAGMNSPSVQEILETFDANLLKASGSLETVTDQQLMENWPAKERRSGPIRPAQNNRSTRGSVQSPDTSSRSALGLFATPGCSFTFDLWTDCR